VNGEESERGEKKRAISESERENRERVKRESRRQVCALCAQAHARCIGTRRRTKKGKQKRGKRERERRVRERRGRKQERMKRKGKEGEQKVGELRSLSPTVWILCYKPDCLDR